jgi:hypothetical protein
LTHNSRIWESQQPEVSRTFAVEFDRSINTRGGREAAYILKMGELAVAQHTQDILSAINYFSAVKWLSAAG